MITSGTAKVTAYNTAKQYLYTVSKVSNERVDFLMKTPCIYCSAFSHILVIV